MALPKKDQEIHDEMLSKLVPFVEYLQAIGFGYWITVGRKGTGANYCGGSRPDVVAAVTDLLERNPQVASTLKQAIDESLH